MAVRAPFILKHGEALGSLQMTCFSFIAALVLAKLSKGRDSGCDSPPCTWEPPFGVSKCLVLCSPQKMTRGQHGP